MSSAAILLGAGIQSYKCMVSLTYILDKMVYNSLLHDPSLSPGSGTLISPSPPEFQAVM